MGFANGAETRFAYVAETALGTTPATPSFKTLRATSSSMRNNKRTGTSNELRADRNVTAEFLLGKSAGGGYPVEFSYGTYDDLIEAALCGSWTTNVLKNGTTAKSFTFEETIELGATDNFRRFPGSRVNSFSLTVQSESEISGSFDIMAVKENDLAVAALTGATYAAAGTEPIMTAGEFLPGITIGSFSPQPTIRNINFTVTNNLRTRPQVGSLYTGEFGQGKFEVTGNFEAYFDSKDVYQAVLDHGIFPISMTIGKTTAKKYTILFPAAQTLDGSVVVSGSNDDIIATVPFRGVFDATEGCSMKITRAVA
jgi:hypothetical protein